MIELVVRAENMGLASTGCYNKGYSVCAGLGPWGGEVQPPKFVIIRITDADSESQVSQYIEQWKRETEYEILAHDPEDDFFQVRIFADPSKEATVREVTAAEFRSFLEDWGAEAIEDASPGVLFEITAMDAVTSRGLFTFGEQDANVTYEELAYDPSTGIHSVLLDYFASTLTSDYIMMVLKDAGMTEMVFSEATKRCTFNADRAVMINKLKDAVEHRFHFMLARVHYRFSDAIVDEALVTGVKELTLAEIPANIVDIAGEYNG